MITEIIKRDGSRAGFNFEKISQAIYKAGLATGEITQAEAAALAKKVCTRLAEAKEELPSVERIQDEVEKVLIASGKTATAKSYILYRAERSRVREMKTSLMKVFEDLTFKDAKDNDIKRENANIDGDTAMGTMLKYGGEAAKNFYELFIIDPVHMAAHKSGDIHIHDLDFFALTTTCCQIDLKKLFEGGFSTGHGFLREPNDIQSYSALACIAIQSNQNDQHGGQSVPNFDYAMATGVAKTYARLYVQNVGKALDILFDIEDGLDKAKEYAAEIKKEGIIPSMTDNAPFLKAQKKYLEKLGLDAKKIKHVEDFTAKAALKETERATFQAMEAFVHNLNTMHSRAGAQIPFSSINYGTDTTPEGRMVIRNILLATEQGLGNGETPIFPIHIFKVKEGVNYNEGDPNYDLFKLACRVSAKRLFPNFSFLDAPFNLQYYKKGDYESEAAYMGCRTRVFGNYYDPSREVVSGRGNLSFTTVNLPRLGILANGDEKKFFEMLDNMLDITFDQLYARFKIQASKKVRNYPFLMGQGIWIDSDKLDPDEEIEEILKHGTLTTGFIGLAECLKALTGKHHGESEESQKLGLKIVGHMRERCDKKSQETKMNYSLIATPAEGLSGRFLRIDKERFGKIEGITDREYYTNSFHVPVYYNISAFKKIKIEAPYHNLTNGGHISYVEVDGNPSQNLEAFEQIIRFMKENNMGYGSVNHPVDRDPVCGYTGIIENECPKCGRKENPAAPKFERIRRITGYLVGTVDRFNNAKRAEERDRVKHSFKETK